MWPLWHPRGPNVEILKKEFGHEKVHHFESLSGTFRLKSKVNVRVYLHVAWWSAFNGFQDRLNLDPLAPAQSKRVFSFK